jgi:hypothetical protein
MTRARTDVVVHAAAVALVIAALRSREPTLVTSTKMPAP